MKFYIHLFLFLACLPVFGKSPELPEKTTQFNNNQFFIENKGQWNDEVLFLARLNGQDAWITKSGVVFDYYQWLLDSNTMELPDPEESLFSMRNTYKSCHVVELNYINIEKKIDKATGVDKQLTYYNYFIGNDSTKWASYVGLYKEALVKNAYPGIDIRYYFDTGFGLRYDFIVAPGADFKIIKMKFDGQDDIFINKNNELVIKTSLGDVIHNKLYTYQESGEEVKSNFVSDGNGYISFNITGYDKSKSLIIDPLIFSTFNSTGGNNHGVIGRSGAAKDGDNMIITGWTDSPNFPTFNGLYTSKNGLADVFISELNSNGTAQVFSTFLGGTVGNTMEEIGTGVVKDNSGIYICGFTKAPNFPTLNAYDNVLNDQDCFVTKFSLTGSSLIYSTFLGGSSADSALCLAVDSYGCAYVCGGTRSTDFPFTSGAYNTISNGGASEGFVSKLSQGGDALLFSTYIGSMGRDVVVQICMDPSTNDVCIAGVTGDPSFPNTPLAYDKTYNGPFPAPSTRGADVFVAKLSGTLNTLLYSTFLGGSDSDELTYLTIDYLGNVYVAGNTFSSNFPVVPSLSCYDPTYNGGSDGFFTKFNSSLSQVLVSTYLGGNLKDEVHGGEIDADLNIYLSGWTFSSNFPVTNRAFQTVRGGNSDAFLCKINSTCDILLYSTFLGGSIGGDDGGGAIILDAQNNVTISGMTYASNFPVTDGAFDGVFNSINEYFITKLALLPCDSLYCFPREIKFGDRSCLSDSNVTITITNPDNQAVEVSNISLFSNSNAKIIVTNMNPGIIPGKGSIQLNVSMKPGGVDQFNDTIYVNYPNGCVKLLKIPVSGKKVIVGFTTNVGDTVDFGKRCLMSSTGTKDTIIKITNTSSQSSLFAASSLSGDFSIIWPNPFSTAFAKDQTKELKVGISGSTPGIFKQDFFITDSCGRVKKITFKVEFINPASLTPIEGPNTVCVNDTIILSNKTTGGIWAIDNPYYTTIDQQGRVIGKNAGTSNISYTSPADANGCTSKVNYSIVVGSLPEVLPIQGPDKLCAGDIQKYTDLTPGGVWSCDDTQYCTINPSGEVTGLKVGETNIKYKVGPNSAGCYNSVTYKILIVEAPKLPNIIGKDTICVNSIELYKNDTLGGSWISLNPSIALFDNYGSLFANGAGSVTILYKKKTSESGCFAVAYKNIEIIDAPKIEISGDSTACVNELSNYKVGIKGLQNVWNVSGGTIVSNSNPDSIFVRWDKSAPYKISLTQTNSANCSSSDTLNIKLFNPKAIQFSSDTLDFGKLEECQSKKIDSIVLWNTGLQDLFIDSTLNKTGFNVISPILPIRILPNGKYTIVVQYNSGTDTTGKIEIKGSPCNWSKIIYCKAQISQLSLISDIDSVDFGRDLSCNTVKKDTSIILTNKGTKPVSLNLSQSILDLPFKLTNAKIDTLIQPNQSLTLHVQYSPSNPDIYSNKLIIPYKVGICNDSIYVYLNAEYIQPKIEYNISEIQFPTLTGCVAKIDTTIMMKNTGDVDIFVQSIEPDSIFKMASKSVKIPAADSLSISFSFEAPNSGVYQGKLIFRLDPCNITDTLVVKGEKLGVLFKATEDLDFGDIVFCKEDSLHFEKSFNVSNLSDPGTDGNIILNNTLASPFSTTLPANDSLFCGKTNTYKVLLNLSSTMPDGESISYLELKLQPCDSIKKIRIRYNKITESIDITKKLDYGSLALNTNKTDTIKVKLNVNKPTTVSSINGINPPFYFVKTIPTDLINLSPGQEVRIIVAYKPTNIANDSIRISLQISNSCYPELFCNLIGSGNNKAKDYKCSVSIQSARVNTGDTLSLNLTLINSQDIIEKGVPSEFSANIKFNGKILFPIISDEIDKGIIAGERTLGITGKMTDTAGVMKTLKFVAALGSSDYSDIVVDSLKWKNIVDLAVEIENGKVWIKDICDKGGKRLVNADGVQLIKALTPNPAKESVLVEFELIEKGKAELAIFNSLGEEIKRFTYENELGEKSQAIPLKDLPSGQYIIILKTMNITNTQSLMIVK